MTYVWLGLVIFLTFIEVITINLVTIWFVMGGILTIIVSLFTDNLLIQFGVFVLSSVILLITTKGILTKFLKKDDIKTNIDRIIEMEGIVVEEINKNQNGAVKVDGKVWTAYSNHKIEVGSTVKVLSITGAKIKVEKVGN